MGNQAWGVLLGDVSQRGAGEQCIMGPVAWYSHGLLWTRVRALGGRWLG